MAIFPGPNEGCHPSEMDFVNWDLFIGDDVTLEVDRLGTRKTVQFKIEELTE